MREDDFGCSFSVDKTTKYTDWVDDDREFRQFLMDNLRWSSVTAEKYVDEIRDKYFPNRQEMSQSEKERGFANVSTSVSLPTHNHPRPQNLCLHQIVAFTSP